jgi:hypothetical protein
MADNQLHAALLTVALNSTKPRATLKRMVAEQYGDVWNDYNNFLKKLEKRMGLSTSGNQSRLNLYLAGERQEPRIISELWRESADIVAVPTQYLVPPLSHRRPQW